MKILTASFALLLTASAANGESLSAALRDVAVVAGRHYTFADIATASAAPAGLLDAEIGVTPRPGQVRHLTRMAVRARLARLDPAWSSIRWHGPGVVKIRGEGVAFPGQSVEDDARTGLLEWLQERYAAGVVRAVGRTTNLMVPAGAVTLKSSLPPAASLRRRMVVSVDVYVDGEYFDTVPQWFSVSVEKPVLVMAVATALRQPFDPGNVRIERRDIAALDSRPLAEPALLEGMRATRDIGPSEILTETDLEPVPPVRQGELITVQVVRGAVRLATRAVALADGEIAERISVRHPTNGQSYAAVVTGKSTARVY